MAHDFTDHTAEATTKPFSDLKKAAIAGDWETVDSMLANKDTVETILKPATVAWALGGGLRDTDDNVRDLAATILGKVERKDFGDLPPDAVLAMEDQMTNDSSSYVRYRLAFALANRIPKDKRSVQLVATLEDAARDPDVEEIAKKYL